MNRTRFVKGGEDRSPIVNRPTMGIVGLKHPVRCDFRSLFLSHYDAMRSTCADIDELGVAAIAIDWRSNELAGILWVSAKAGQPNSAIVGRHSATDLCLAGDPSISLRHLALLVEPVKSWERSELEVSYRLLDLRTREGFHDEYDRQMRGLRVEGPAFIRVGNYALFFLATGDPTDWPLASRDAWDCLPERVYLEERLGEGTGSHGYRRRLEPSQHIESSGVPMSSRRTFIQSTIGPRWVENDLLESGELPLAGLQIRTARNSSILRFGSAAVRDGILLGRYERCDRAGHLADGRISRVHVLIIEVGDELWAIDVASTCGTWQRDAAGRLSRARMTRLTDETRIILADRVAELCRVHPACLA